MSDILCWFKGSDNLKYKCKDFKTNLSKLFGTEDLHGWSEGSELIRTVRWQTRCVLHFRDVCSKR